MFLASTILIDTGEQTVKFVPSEPMDLLEIYQRFSGRHAKVIVTSEANGVARVSVVLELENLLLEQIKEFAI